MPVSILLLSGLNFLRTNFLVNSKKGFDPKDTCVAFNEGGKSKWSCEEGDRKVIYEHVEGDYYFISEDFDHFTGFSVLLGATSPGGCLDFGVLQWLSMAFLIR
jgi:hypothetical protein